MALAAGRAAPGSRCRASRRGARHPHRCAASPAAPPPDTLPSPPALALRAPSRGLSAAVVGGGVGGLALAARLARDGYAVTLFEKNDGVGGRMQGYSPPAAAGFRFDTGPSLLLFPDKYRECFASIGVDMDKALDVVSPAYRAHFGDGTTFDLSYDMGVLRAQLEAVEPGAGGAFFDWLGRARASLDLGVRAFIERDSTSATDFVNPALVLPLALKVNPLELLGSSHAQMSAYFKSPKLRALFSFQDLYVGLSPYSAPGVFSLLAATELTDGVWYPKGGFGTVRDALHAAAVANGVAIRTGAEVARIELCDDEAGGSGAADAPGGASPAPARPRVRGVTLAGGEFVQSDIVVANADLPYVFSSLLSSGSSSAAAAAASPLTPPSPPPSPPRPEYDAEAARVDAMDFSASVVAFNWALSAPLPGLLHHNVFLSSDFKGSWDRPCAPSDMDAPRQLNFYAHYPCVTDPSAAPPGCSSLMVLLPVGNLKEQRTAAAKAAAKAARRGGAQPPPPPSDDGLPDPAVMVAAAKAAVLRRLSADGHGDVGSLIVSETVIAPAEWRDRYNIAHGAVFGLSHGLLQLACFRPPTRTGLPGWSDTPETKGLYFVGASTRPGNGVPLVMMGVKTCFEAIVKEREAEGAAAAQAERGAPAGVVAR